jgi:hypothetical protein
MQLAPLTGTDWLLAILTLALTNATTAAVVNWLTTRRKVTAETVQITAQSVKAEAEARQIANATLMAAQNRIVELVEINSELQRENIEAVRKSDNFEYELGQTRRTVADRDKQIEVYEMQLDKYRAAEKLGQVLEKLPEVLDRNGSTG